MPDATRGQVCAPNVLIKGRFFSQRISGVRRYARETILCLDELLANGAQKNIDWTLLVPRTGVFFSDQTPEAVRDAVREFETMGEFPAEVCCANAERFSIDNFEKHFVAAVHAAPATSNWGCA